MNSAAAHEAPRTTSVGGARRDATGDQAQASACSASGDKPQVSLLHELASVFMDSATILGPTPRDAESHDVPQATSAVGGREKNDLHVAQSGTTTPPDEHGHEHSLLLLQQFGQAVQAMQRLSAAVERNSTELGEFRAAQHRMQEQTLQFLTDMKNASSAQQQRRESTATMYTGATRACTTISGEDDDASFSLKDDNDDNDDDDDDDDDADEEEEEPPDQSQVLDRKRDRLDGLEVYAVVSAISAGTMVAVFDSYQPAGGDVFDLFHQGRYLEFLMSAIFLITGSVGIVCSLHCIFIFSLVTMYGRTAIGMDRDDALDIFFAGTGIQRFHGFRTFVGSLYALMFELIVVITSKVSDKPFVHLLAVIVTSRLMYNVYSDTQIVMDKASVIFAPRPQISSDSTKDDASLSLGSIGNNSDDESIAIPALTNDDNACSQTEFTPSTSLSSSLDLRNSASLARRSSVRRISGLSSMNLGAEELMIQEQKEETQKKDRANILVVDDSATSRRLLVKRVEKLGHAASQAADGDEALEMLRNAATVDKPGGQYDLVLLDNYMPKLNGDEVLEEMQKNKDLQNIPVIMISGNEDVAQKAKCIELGASDFLPKPFDAVIFKARVVACLQARRLQELQESSDETSGPEDTITSRPSLPGNTNNTSLRSLGSIGSGKKPKSRRRSSGMSMNLGAEQLIKEQRQAKRVPKILVVDDSATSRRLLTKRVEKLGHVFETASDGQEALDILKGSKNGEDYDLVLLDMFMPKLNGDKVLEEMKKDKALTHIPVIMISGAEDVSQKARCIELGASDFLPKPFDPIIFKARVVACLRAKRIRERRGRVE